MNFVVVYAKAVDDKEVGIYLEGIYFGGIASDSDGADKIARVCTNTIRGGQAILRIMPIDGRHSLLDIFDEARHRFEKVERQMVEAEDILSSNNERAKKRRK